MSSYIISTRLLTGKEEAIPYAKTMLVVDKNPLTKVVSVVMSIGTCAGA